jgi:tetratricopeptide (TPR) repeat protein
MRTTHGLTLIVAALVAAPSIRAIDAQDSRSSAIAPSRGGTGAGSLRLTGEEAALVAARTAQADEWTTVGRYRDARRALREILELQERGGVYTAPTLRRLANVEFSLERPLAAASILERAADAASAAGDPITEIQALVDAMIVYGQEGRRNRARELRPRIEALLNSPAIPEGLRLQLARHLITD